MKNAAIRPVPALGLRGAQAAEVPENILKKMETDCDCRSI